MEGLTVAELTVNDFWLAIVDFRKRLDRRVQNSVRVRLSRTSGLQKEKMASSSRMYSILATDLTKVNTIKDTTQEELIVVQQTGTHPSALSDLSKRKLIEKKKIFYFSVQKGPDFTLDIRKQETDISVEMLQRFLPQNNPAHLLTPQWRLENRLLQTIQL